MKRTIAAVASCALLVTAAAWAQERQEKKTTTTTTTKTTQGATKSPDEKFIAGATSGGNFEIKSSEMALKMSNNAEIKAMAQKIIDDHRKANDELSALLAKRNQKAVQGVNPVHQAMLDTLAKHGGTDFDECYLEQQILAHEEAVGCFTKEMKLGGDAELKAFAAKTLPALKGHLMHARRDCEMMVEKMSKAAQ